MLNTISTTANTNTVSQGYQEKYGHGFDVFNLFLKNDNKLPEDIYRFLWWFLTYDDPTKIIRWLVNNYPEMEGLLWPLHPTPEKAQEMKTPTIGEKIFGIQIEKKALDEFNRTAVGVMCLKRALMDQKDKFTECQSINTRLNDENRKQLRQFTLNILGYDPKALDAMIYYLLALDAVVSYTVINDLGKTETFEQTIEQEFKMDFADHDHLLAFWLEHKPELSPSFSRTNKEYQKVMLDWLKCKLNVGQFMQWEMPSWWLSTIKWMDKKAFDFFMIHFLFDLAGAAWHGVQNGSITINNPTFERFQTCYTLLEKVRTSQITYQEAYDQYLNRNTNHFANFEIKKASDVVIAKVITLLRLTDKGQIEILKEEYNNLDKDTKAILEYHMNKSWYESDYAFLLYYAPAFLANLMREMQKVDKIHWLRNTVKLWLKTLARIYQKVEIHYINSPKKEWTIICNISEIAWKMSDSGCFSQLTDFDIDIDIKGDGVKASFKDKRIDISDINYFHSIDNIPGDKFLVIAMWGGSDSVQATEIANLLKRSGKQVQAVLSVRTNKTGSQQWKDVIGEERQLQNVDTIEKNLYKIHPDSLSTTWRFYEYISAKEWNNTYLIMYNPDEEGEQEISEKIKKIQQISGAQTILCIDTWGDVLYKFSEKQAKHGHSKDQDTCVRDAVAMVDTVQEKHLLVLAPGIDTPDDANEIIKKQWWVMYIPNTNESRDIVDFYERQWFDGSDEQKYGKTSNAFYLANKNWETTWFQPMLSIPKDNIIASENPRDPYVNIQEYTKGWLLFSIK